MPKGVGFESPLEHQSFVFPKLSVFDSATIVVFGFKSLVEVLVVPFEKTVFNFRQCSNSFTGNLPPLSLYLSTTHLLASCPPNSRPNLSFASCLNFSQSDSELLPLAGL